MEFIPRRSERLKQKEVQKDVQNDNKQQEIRVDKTIRKILGVPHREKQQISGLSTPPPPFSEEARFESAISSTLTSISRACDRFKFMQRANNLPITISEQTLLMHTMAPLINTVFSYPHDSEFHVF